jgi:hypothetical protein
MNSRIETKRDNCNSNNPQQTSSWRQRLRIHPAAELFPLDSDDIRVLADDIRQYGLQEPVSVIKDGNGYVLLDGRNRLDAMEMAGKKIDINDRGTFEHLSASIDVHAFVVSKNIRRRHLTAEQKRGLIGKLLQAQPEKSDRQIAKQAKASPTKTRRIIANSKLTAFRSECWRLSALTRQGVVNKIAAIDLLYEVAIGHALVRALGEDRVTAIIAEAFAGAEFDPLCAEVA